MPDLIFLLGFDVEVLLLPDALDLVDLDPLTVNLTNHLDSLSESVFKNDLVFSD